MKFAEFAKRLKNIISGLESGNGGDFARELFENIHIYDKERYGNRISDKGHVTV